MFTEDDLLPISALQHLVFCERQCALIHLEREWAENTRTLEGRRLHDRTDENGPRVERRDGMVVLRGMALKSMSLGLVGKSDVVELHEAEPGEPGTLVPGFNGEWVIVPVEYKRGRPKRNRCDEIQLCAQAMCLEEMFNSKVETGFLFYGKTRRRFEVSLDGRLVDETLATIERLRRLLGSGNSPPAEYGPKCESCSLVEICVPSVAGGGTASAIEYLKSSVRRVLADWERE